VRDQERQRLVRARRAQADEQVDAPFADVRLGIHALVAHHAAGAAHVAGAEKARGRQRLQEVQHLAGELVPHAAISRLEHGPARAALDAADDEQGAAPQREQRTVGAAPRPARECPQREAMLVGRAQGLQGIDTVRGEPRALTLGEPDRRSRPRTQQQLVVGPRLPRRAHLVLAREYARHGAAVRERLIAAAQPVVREDAGKRHQSLVRLQVEFVQPADRRVATRPRRRRIDDQHRAEFAAHAARRHERTRPEIAIARRGREVQEAHVVHRAQREEPAAPRGRSDQVVVGERLAVVAVRIGVDVTDRVALARAVGPVWPLFRYDAPHANERGLLQRSDDVARAAGYHRQSAEDLLVLDVLGSGGPHALYHEVESVVLVRADVVVVHGGAQ